jgi:hypothetical protein
MRSLYYSLKPKFFICLNLLTHFLQGLILSNALRAQKDAEDKGCTIALSNLCSEVIELRNEGLEKDLCNILDGHDERLRHDCSIATIGRYRCFVAHQKLLRI